MKKITVYLIVAFCCLSSSSIADFESKIPLKYISSCELDFNNDGSEDIALLVETAKGRELIILMRKPEGFNAFLISNVGQYEYLSCYYGDSLQETAVGKKGKKRAVFKTSGTYLSLAHPEGPSRDYFWNGNGFTEVSTSD